MTGLSSVARMALESPAVGRWRQPSPQTAATRAPASFWLLLVFLLLLYANTPKLLPVLEVFRPAAVVGGCALLALAGETLLGGRKLVYAWPEGGLLVAFVGAAALSCLTALWPGHAVDALSDLVKMSLVFFFLVNSANSEGRLRGVMWTMVLGGLFPALGTLNNYRNYNMEDGRAAWIGIFANPNEVAYSLVILLPLAAYLAGAHGWFARLALLAISSVYVAAIFVTFSRGGLIGLVAVIAVYAWLKRSAWLRGGIILVTVGGLIVAGRYWTRSEDFSALGTDVTVRQRIATSQVGLSMFADHPWIGVGLGCSVIAWPLYAPKDLYASPALVTHNTFVQVLGETGVAGAIPFLLLIGFAVYHAHGLARRSNRPNLGIAIEAALWGLIACGMSGGYVLTWFPYLLVGLAATAWNLAPATLEKAP